MSKEHMTEEESVLVGKIRQGAALTDVNGNVSITFYPNEFQALLLLFDRIEEAFPLIKTQG